VSNPGKKFIILSESFLEKVKVAKLFKKSLGKKYEELSTNSKLLKKKFISVK
jgi:hypothetical protein